VTARGFSRRDHERHLPWYLVDASTVAGRALARLGTTPQLTDIETVTSDTAAPNPGPQTIALTWRRLLAAWPYVGGTIPQPLVLERQEENTVIGFAYPTEDAYFRWTVAPDGKLLAQTISTPGHLIHDDFRYP
jgi:hypothetical protein